MIFYFIKKIRILFFFAAINKDWLLCRAVLSPAIRSCYFCCSDAANSVKRIVVQLIEWNRVKGFSFRWIKTLSNNLSRTFCIKFFYKLCYLLSWVFPFLSFISISFQNCILFGSHFLFLIPNLHLMKKMANLYFLSNYNAFQTKR